MKKRTLSFLLALVMCLTLLPMTALAATETLKDVELPKPATPNYFKVENRGKNDCFYIYALLDTPMVELATEHGVDAAAFYAKYGIENEGYDQFELW